MKKWLMQSWWISEKYKFAASYRLPLYRILFFSKEANKVLYKKKFKERLKNFV